MAQLDLPAIGTIPDFAAGESVLPPSADAIAMLAELRSVLADFTADTERSQSNANNYLDALTQAATAADEVKWTFVERE